MAIFHTGIPTLYFHINKMIASDLFCAHEWKLLVPILGKLLFSRSSELLNGWRQEVGWMAFSSKAFKAPKSARGKYFLRTQDFSIGITLANMYVCQESG